MVVCQLCGRNSFRFDQEAANWCVQEHFYVCDQHGPLVGRRHPHPARCPRCAGRLSRWPTWTFVPAVVLIFATASLFAVVIPSASLPSIHYDSFPRAHVGSLQLGTTVRVAVTIVGPDRWHPLVETSRGGFNGNNYTSFAFLGSTATGNIWIRPSGLQYWGSFPHVAIGQISGNPVTFSWFQGGDGVLVAGTVTAATNGTLELDAQAVTATLAGFLDPGGALLFLVATVSFAANVGVLVVGFRLPVLRARRQLSEHPGGPEQVRDVPTRPVPGPKDDLPLP